MSETICDKNEIGDLYFERSNGERVLLLENCNMDQSIEKINKFLDEHNFTSYYTRLWRHDNEICFDVGSHSEFFYLVLKK